MEDNRYPIGRFKLDKEVTPEKRRRWIQEIHQFPARLRDLVENLSAEQLDSTYRPGGWTGRQVVHHLADSHVNAYVRFRLALTEDSPAIKTYEQTTWAELPDARRGDVHPSLELLEGLHRRWTELLQAMKPEDFSRTFTHPEWGKPSLDFNLQLYAWHGNHHLAHLKQL